MFGYFLGAKFMIGPTITSGVLRVMTLKMTFYVAEMTFYVAKMTFYIANMTFYIVNMILGNIYHFLCG